MTNFKFDIAKIMGLFNMRNHHKLVYCMGFIVITRYIYSFTSFNSTNLLTIA